MGIRLAGCCLFAVACVINMPGATPSQPQQVTAGGTWTCQQIVEQCDAQCQIPTCLDDCTARGTPEAQQQHQTVIACGKRNFCTDEACMRANCSNEMQGCGGADAVQGAQPSPQAP